MRNKTPIEVGDLIELIDDPVNHWGIVTSISDDGSTVYFRHKGASLFHSSTLLSNVRHGWGSSKYQKQGE